MKHNMLQCFESLGSFELNTELDVTCQKNNCNDLFNQSLLNFPADQ